MGGRKKKKKKYQKRKRSNEPPEQLSFENGQPCGSARCQTNRMRKPCGQCGRVNARGKAIIKIRNGSVYLERLTPGNIKRYAKLSAAKQKKHELVIWLDPLSSLSDYKLKED